VPRKLRKKREKEMPSMQNIVLAATFLVFQANEFSSLPNTLFEKKINVMEHHLKLIQEW